MCAASCSPPCAPRTCCRNSDRRCSDACRCACSTATPTVAERVLAGAPAATPGAAHGLHEADLSVRRPPVDLARRDGAGRAPGIGRTWPLALVGLVGAALLGALLLIVTGRARRIEAAVQSAPPSCSSAVPNCRPRRSSASAPRWPCATASNGCATSSTTCRSAWPTPTPRAASARPTRTCARCSAATAAAWPAATMARLLHRDDRPAEATRASACSPARCRWRAAQLRCLTADGRTIADAVGVSVLRDGRATRPAHGLGHRGHHRAPGPGGGPARTRRRRGGEPGQERVPVAHEPRAAHAAERDARFRAAARARPPPAAGAAPARLDRRRCGRPAGTCCT